ncbi:MAG: hypothetical protein QXT74_05200 [Candidatus Nezhaarchaeales archaeon]
MAERRVVRVVRERGWASQLLMLLAAALLILLVPQLVVVPIAYLGFALIRSLRRRRLQQAAGVAGLRPRWSPLRARINASRLKRVGGIKDCHLFIPDGDPACLLALRGFTLTGTGCLYVKLAEPHSLDARPLVNAAMRMRRQLVLSLIVCPSERGRLRIGAAALISVRSSKRCLKVGEDEVRDVAEDVERCLDGVRAVVLSQPQGAEEVVVLRGDELLEAGMLLAGVSG